jgi:hypothetical protein
VVPGPWVFSPPPKPTNVVPVVIAIVLVVVIVTVVLAAVLYVMFAGLVTDRPPSRPAIGLTAPTLSGVEASFSVATASRRVSTDLFSVNLFVNTTLGTPRPLASSFTLTVGADTYAGSYLDVNGDGLLSPGDGFRITPGAGWRRQTTYQFEVLWSDESPVGFVSWTT